MATRLDSVPHLWSTALRACLLGFERLGLDTREICVRTGIDERVVDDPDARIPITRTNAIWPIAAEMFGPGVGLHCGAEVAFGELEVFDYVIAVAPTIESGARSLARYFFVVSEGVTRVTVENRAPGESLRLGFAGAVPLEVRDYAITVFARRLRRSGAIIERFELIGSPIADIEDYRRIHPEPISFGAETNTIVITSESATAPIESEVPGLRDVVLKELDDRLEQVMSRAGDDRTLRDVRSVVVRMLPGGTPRLDEIAPRLHMSVRTLQRRLADHGLTFTDLVDDTRSELARIHLQDERLSIADVGYLLGFAEPSSFTRAFSRWFERSPAEYRGALFD